MIHVKQSVVFVIYELPKLHYVVLLNIRAVLSEAGDQDGTGSGAVNIVDRLFDAVSEKGVCLIFTLLGCDLRFEMESEIHLVA